MIKFKHYRHATSIIEIENKKILIDPVLADLGKYPPIQNTNNKRNPLVKFPTKLDKIFNIDGIIITHDHNDHFDLVAKEIMPKEIPLLCQKEDYIKFKDLGFNKLTPIKDNTTWLGINIKRMVGTHGGRFWSKKLGISSSYLLSIKNLNVYLTGDTLLTRNVRSNIKRLQPKIIIANGGGARIKLLGKITMNNKDIIKLSKTNKKSKVIAVHMDSINHCLDTREKLNKLVKPKNLIVPKDGEILTVE